MVSTLKKPEISVVIPALNSEKTIRGCVKSLLNQKYPEDKYEIIVVDNGSTDNTLDILQEFRNKIVILKEPKKGSYNARNMGIRYARGDIIVFTDSDCFVGENWMRKIVNAFKNPDIKIVGGKIKAHKTNTALLKYCNVFCHNQKEYYNAKMCITSNISIRKNDLIKAGLFNHKLLSGGDLEFCSRIIKDHKEIMYVPNAIVYHDYSTSLLTFMKKSFIYGKWTRTIKKTCGKSFYIKKRSYFKILKDYNLFFLFFRFLQDVSFKMGFFIGGQPIIKKDQ